MTIDKIKAYALNELKIFPCAKDKRPLTPHGFKDATSDADKIKSYWREHPQALIGLATGEVNNVVVLDFDLHKDGSCLTQFETEFKLSLEGHPYKVRTMNGGLHFYFRYPKGYDIRSRNGFRSSVDVKANGGYVIAADGETYRLDGAPSPDHASGVRTSTLAVAQNVEIA